ncbi:MAG: right-handed parallel beta-helix repeat-containing protein [Phycisphaerae bacterium]
MNKIVRVAAHALLASIAFGQSFNIDLDLPAGHFGTGAPTNAFGAAAGQPGFWNIVAGIGGNQVLKGLNGVNTSATLQTSGDFAFRDGNANGDGDFAKLIEDTFQLAGAGATFTFTVSNLAPGRYFVYTYGDDPTDAIVHTRVAVDGDLKNCGGAHGVNQFIENVTHVRHVVDVSAGQQVLINILSNASVAGSRGVISGLQIVPVPSRLYVRSNAPAGGNGESWATAYQGLGSALNTARALAPAVEEIWVASGTYYTPSAGALGFTFDLASDVRVYGGFAGNETLLAQRNPAPGLTYLSGSIGAPTATDNAWHVVQARGCGAGTLLDGFTISSGYADSGGGSDYLGGGMWIDDSQVTVRNCNFVGNYAVRGGAVASRLSTARFERCQFFNNTGSEGGGGVYSTQSDVELARCTFRTNHATTGIGGAVYFNEGGQHGLYNCTLQNNDARDGGGAVALSALGTVMLTTIANCVISGNECLTASGGAIFAHGDESFAIVSNCSIVGNSAVSTGGAYGHSQTAMYIRNSVLWGNVDSSPATGTEAANLAKTAGVTLTVHYSNVQGWTNTLGNTSTHGMSPLFVDADGPDNVYGSVDDDLRLQAGSPNIDRASNSYLEADLLDLDGDSDWIEQLPVDLDESVRRFDDPGSLNLGIGPSPIVDIGAYEFTPQCDLDGDLDQDGDVDLTDLATLLANFGLASGQTRATGDVTGDGAVNLTDLSSLLANYGSACP